MRLALLRELLAAQEEKRPVVVATRLADGEQALLHPLESADAATPDGWPLEEARRALASDRTTVHEGEEGPVLLRPYNPPVRLVVVGAVHVAQTLVRLAAQVGIESTVVDPRTAFATEERFPGVRMIHAWPDQAMAELAPDHRTAVVTLTHDPKVDDPALLAVLDGPAFYVGALGSRRTHERRVARLREAGASEEQIERIQAPIGLDIGARTPAEIAVAVLAELLAHLRGAGG